MKYLEPEENQQDVFPVETPKTVLDEEPGETPGSLDSLFLQDSLNAVIPALINLIDLDACEIYLREKGMGGLSLDFRYGRLFSIWDEAKPAQAASLLMGLYDKGEMRVIDLPNRRVSELNPELREKAFGQVACLPIAADDETLGIVCFAHTRRSLLSARELAFMQAANHWIAEMIANEARNQQARVQVINEERERIGMDLHDGIIQSLYGIGLSLENARLGLSQGHKNDVQQIEKSIESLQSAIADIRAYILDLRPRQLRHSNMLEGMRSLIRELRANTMVDVSLDGNPQDVDGLARVQIDALFHIFQEAISNTAKHAKATKVTVRLWRRGERVLLKVSDDGGGFDTPRPGSRIGHGLTNMQARAEAAGGGIEVISIRKQGTTLLAWVPFIQESKK